MAFPYPTIGVVEGHAFPMGDLPRSTEATPPTALCHRSTRRFDRSNHSNNSRITRRYIPAKPPLKSRGAKGPGTHMMVRAVLLSLASIAVAFLAFVWAVMGGHLVNFNAVL